MQVPKHIRTCAIVRRKRFVNRLLSSESFGLMNPLGLGNGAGKRESVEQYVQRWKGNIGKAQATPNARILPPSPLWASLRSKRLLLRP